MNGGLESFERMRLQGGRREEEGREVVVLKKRPRDRVRATHLERESRVLSSSLLHP